jgi:hypothetical protein
MKKNELSKLLSSQILYSFHLFLVVNVFLLSVKVMELQHALLIFVLEPNIFEILSLPNFDDNPHI